MTPKSGVNKKWYSTGYKTVNERAKQMDANKGNSNRLYSLYLKGDGDSRRVRFLTDEPFLFDEHAKQVDGKWRFKTCLKNVAKYCPMCQKWSKPKFVGAYLVYDYDEEDVARKVKVFKQGITVLKMLAKHNTRPGGLLGFDIEITRAGVGKETSYNFNCEKKSKFTGKLKDGLNKLKEQMFKDNEPMSLASAEALVSVGNDEENTDSGSGDEDSLPF